jgi:integration host factor subunit beta
MKKSILIETLNMKKEVSLQEKTNMVNYVFDWLAKSLEEKHSIELRDFGTFELRLRPSRSAMNPKTGYMFHISQRFIPFFRAGKKVKMLINKQHSE